MKENIEEEITKSMAREIQEEIDFEILTSIFIESGWTKVILSPMTTETSQEIDNWIEENIKSQHMTRGLVWVFEDEKEAMWFTLRWYNT